MKYLLPVAVFFLGVYVVAVACLFIYLSNDPIVERTPVREPVERFYGGLFDGVPTSKLDYMSIGNDCYEIYYTDNTSEEGCFND